MHNSITTEKLAYSIEELAALSTLSAPKIRKDIRNGKLSSTKKGTRRIILRDEVMRYLSADDADSSDGQPPNDRI
ncbi:MAG: helix-turn-helix domain-containing protein [Pyrinomonadaceae bacterium]